MHKWEQYRMGVSDFFYFKVKWIVQLYYETKSHIFLLPLLTKFIWKETVK